MRWSAVHVKKKASHETQGLLVGVPRPLTAPQTKKGTRAMNEPSSAAGLMAAIVYGGDIQSIRTDHCSPPRLGPHTDGLHGRDGVGP